MLRRVFIPLALIVGFVVSGFGPPATFALRGTVAKEGRRSVLSRYVLLAQQEESTSPRASTPVTFLQINDVYSTIPIDGAGGLARVAMLKQQLAAAGKTPVLVIAGDFLSPSVASSVFKG